jgi:hypothetical protein
MRTHRPTGPPRASTRFQRSRGSRAGGAGSVPSVWRKRAGFAAHAPGAFTSRTSLAALATRTFLATAVAAAAAAAALLLFGAASSAAAAAAGAPRGLAGGVAFLLARQVDDGGFAEQGRAADPGLTAWAVLALAASGSDPVSALRDGHSPADHLRGKPYPTATDLELRILAFDALGRAAEAEQLGRQLETLRRPSGAIGSTVNSTIWGVIALRSIGRPAGAAAVAYLLGQQARNGGFPWYAGGEPDSNDAAAAVMALRAAGVDRRARAIERALAYLRGLQNADGGFELSAGRGSDAQSTAWAIQAFLAAGRQPPPRALAYLRRLQRPDGSFRYSARYATTPVWVTAQVLPALARRPFPLP